MMRHKDKFFMSLAEQAAKFSTCDRAPQGVGAVIVSKDLRLLGVGHADAIPGQRNCNEVGHLMIDGRCQRTVHAELSALHHALRSGKPHTCFTTLSPCWDCFKYLVAAGVERIVYLNLYRKGIPPHMAEIANAYFSGVRIERLDAP